MDEKRGSRINVTSKLPKVNAALAEQLLSKSSKAAEKTKTAGASELIDSRFQQLFKNPLFEIDPTSREFAQWHPHSSKKRVMHAIDSDDGEQSEPDAPVLAERKAKLGARK
jgi:hypothetical protein